jgi:putative tryptophan/tyrosine transport system substrate-binding protein
VVARAQQRDRVRRIGVLMALDENDPEAKALLSGFTHGLADLGWTVGRNLRMDVRWVGDNVDRMQVYAKKLLRAFGDKFSTSRRLTEITVSTENATAKGLKNRIFSPGQGRRGSWRP